MCIARLQSPYTLTLNRSISMSIYTHKHHIIPRHMGGTDDPSNLVVLSIEDHAQAHLDLYEQHGLMQDLVAHRMLLGQIDKAEAIKLLQKAPKSERWKQKARERNTGEGNPMYGKTTSDKQKKAVGKSASERFKGVSKNYKVHRPDTRGALNGMSSKIRVGDIVYDTMNDCAETHGVSRVTVRNRILSKTKRFNDWSYYEE
jgi:hypothetical protein